MSARSVVRWTEDPEGRMLRCAATLPAGEVPARLTTPGGETLELSPAAVTAAGGLCACLVCGHPELYTKKDFPVPLGILIVVVAAALAPFTYYASLGVAALIDFVLLRLSGDVVLCYVCDAEHRGFAPEPRHPRFDIEIAERLKYGDKAVMGKPMRPGGTADAPEPEH